MSASTKTAGDRSKLADIASAVRAARAGMSVLDAANALGISKSGVVALADAGILGAIGTDSAAPRLDAEDLTERIWRAALPTASDSLGVPLRAAVKAAGGHPRLWPAVIAALLDGRLNAFRRRGAFGGPVLAALIVSSERVVAELAPTASGGDAPFIWTPTPDRINALGQKRPR